MHTHAAFVHTGHAQLGKRDELLGEKGAVWRVNERTVMLGLRPRLRVVRLVKTAMSVAGKGHCRLKPRMSRRMSVPFCVQICPGKEHQLVNRRPSRALRVFQSEHTAAVPLQQLHTMQSNVNKSV